jgi:hypothetical protein
MRRAILSSSRSIAGASGVFGVSIRELSATGALHGGGGGGNIRGGGGPRSPLKSRAAPGDPISTRMKKNTPGPTPKPASPLKSRGAPATPVDSMSTRIVKKPPKSNSGSPREVTPEAKPEPQSSPTAQPAASAIPVDPISTRMLAHDQQQPLAGAVDALVHPPAPQSFSAADDRRGQPQQDEGTPPKSIKQSDQEQPHHHQPARGESQPASGELGDDRKASDGHSYAPWAFEAVCSSIRGDATCPTMLRQTVDALSVPVYCWLAPAVRSELPATKQAGDIKVCWNRLNFSESPFVTHGLDEITVLCALKPKDKAKAEARAPSTHAQPFVPTVDMVVEADTTRVAYRVTSVDGNLVTLQYASHVYPYIPVECLRPAASSRNPNAGTDFAGALPPTDEEVCDSIVKVWSRLNDLPDKAHPFFTQRCRQVFMDALVQEWKALFPKHVRTSVRDWKNLAGSFRTSADWSSLLQTEDTMFWRAEYLKRGDNLPPTDEEVCDSIVKVWSRLNDLPDKAHPFFTQQRRQVFVDALKQEWNKLFPKHVREFVHVWIGLAASFRTSSDSSSLLQTDVTTGLRAEYLKRRGDHIHKTKVLPFEKHNIQIAHNYSVTLINGPHESLRTLSVPALLSNHNRGTVERALAARNLPIIYGGSGSGKTNLALSMVRSDKDSVLYLARMAEVEPAVRHLNYFSVRRDEVVTRIVTGIVAEELKFAIRPPKTRDAKLLVVFDEMGSCPTIVRSLAEANLRIAAAILKLLDLPEDHTFAVRLIVAGTGVESFAFDKQIPPGYSSFTMVRASPTRQSGSVKA